MAHKKGQGSSNNGRDSQSKRLGVKIFGGEYCIPGNIIVRQRGTKFHAGENVGMGKDHTLFSKAEGFVTFSTTTKNRKFISVLPNGSLKQEVENAEVKTVAKKAAPKKAEAEAVEKPKAKKAPSTKGDKLVDINGIGPAFAKRLNALGIFTFDDLIALTDKKIEKLEEKDSMTSLEQWHEWIEQAKELKG